MNKKMAQLIDKLKDERSKDIIFVSHCILNENARYLGGAFNKGCVPKICKDILEKGFGIVQMHCPEQLVWGGVLKKYMWMAFASKNTMIYRLRKLILPIFIFYTKYRYHKIANQVVKLIQNYEINGFHVRGIVGIDGSPTCGVNLSLNMKKCFELIAPLTIDTLDRAKMNERMYVECQSSKPGLIIADLRKQLDKKKLNIKIYSHNLISEMNHEDSTIKFE